MDEISFGLFPCVHNRVCDEEATESSLKLPLKRKLERIFLYTGVSVSAIKKFTQKIKKRLKTNPDKMISSSGKKRPRETAVEKLDDFFEVVRNLINRFYLEFKLVPTIRKLLQKLQEESNFPFAGKRLGGY